MKGYQIKISVQWTDPEVWRRVWIPSRLTFRDLHLVIQMLFGWKNEYIYEFYMEDSECVLTGNPYGKGNGSGGRMAPEKLLADDFLRKEKHIWYLYDYGETWEHLIEIEKTVEMDRRCPQVLDGEGPNMDEKYGSVLEFELKREEAPSFRAEEVNEWFRSNMEIPIRKREILFRVAGGKRHWETDDRMKDLLQEMREEGGGPRWETIRKERAEDVPRTLAESYAGRSREELCEIARHCRFRGYSKLRKRELESWLQDRLLEEDVMFRLMKKSSAGELELFDRAVRDGCVEVPDESRQPYDFLWKYCVLDSAGCLAVPENVRMAYEKLNDSGRRRTLQEAWKIRTFCQGAVYLYGMISVKELKELWKQYEGNMPDDLLLKEVLQEWKDSRGTILFDGKQIMDEWLEETEDRQKLEKEREGIERYLPESMDEFLRYGREGRQEPDAQTERALRFFCGKLSSGKDGTELFYDIREQVRIQGASGNMTELLRSLPVTVPRGKPEYEWLVYVRETAENTRSWHTNGFTLRELGKHVSGERKASEAGNLRILPEGKKIYPNDPCPCGSGRKYKHCCGRKQ